MIYSKKLGLAVQCAFKSASSSVNFFFNKNVLRLNNNNFFEPKNFPRYDYYILSDRNERLRVRVAIENIKDVPELNQWGLFPSGPLPESILKEILDNTFTCALVRNPWRRLVSSYSQACYLFANMHEVDHIQNQYKEVCVNGFQRGVKEKQRIQHDLKLAEILKPYNYEFKNKDGFKAFAEAICRHSGFVNPHWEHQHLQIYNGRPWKYKYIGKVENINEFFQVLTDNGKNIEHREATRENKGTNYNYQDYYDTKTIDMVGEFYQKDIELFDYEYVSLK